MQPSAKWTWAGWRSERTGSCRFAMTRWRTRESIVTRRAAPMPPAEIESVGAAALPRLKMPPTKGREVGWWQQHTCYGIARASHLLAPCAEGSLTSVVATPVARYRKSDRETVCRGGLQQRLSKRHTRTCSARARFSGSPSAVKSDAVCPSPPYSTIAVAIRSAAEKSSASAERHTLDRRAGPTAAPRQVRQQPKPRACGTSIRYSLYRPSSGESFSCDHGSASPMIVASPIKTRVELVICLTREEGQKTRHARLHHDLPCFACGLRSVRPGTRRAMS